MITRYALDRVKPSLYEVGSLLMVVFTSAEKDNFRNKAKVLLLITFLKNPMLVVFTIGQDDYVEKIL